MTRLELAAIVGDEKMPFVDIYVKEVLKKIKANEENKKNVTKEKISNQ